jgi:hypothetical protein
MSTTPIIQLVQDHEIACPICGITILDAEELHEQPSCPHVRFIYANGEAFEFCDGDLEAILAEGEAKADEQDEFFDMWDALEQQCRSEDVILEQKDEGTACGPVSFTVWIGIRSSPSASYIH